MEDDYGHSDSCTARTYVALTNLQAHRVATPLKYGESGIMTFLIGRDGIVYEQDLGPDTVKLAASVTEYNPDENWSPVE